MKILIIQEKGRRKQNENFRESLNFQRAFQKLNIETIVWGLNYPNFNIPFNEISKDVYYQINLDKVFFHQAISNIKEEPTRYLILYAKKFISFLSAGNLSK